MEDYDAYIAGVTNEVCSLIGAPCGENAPADVVETVRVTCGVVLRWIPITEQQPPIRRYLLISVDGHVPAGILAYIDNDGFWYSGEDSQRIKSPDLIRYWRLV